MSKYLNGSILRILNPKMLLSLTHEGEDKNKEVEVCQKHTVRGLENSPN